MARAKYRPIDMRIWNDRHFLKLSDRGKLLWMFLLTAPCTLMIPGVIVGGDHVLAEQIGWDAEGVREGVSELLRVGMHAHKEGRVIWLSNALKYQPPAGPNHIKAWANCWHDIPDGDLKRRIWEALKIACKRWSIIFAKHFPNPIDDGFAQLSLDPIPDPIPNGLDTGSGSGSVTETGSKKDPARTAVGPEFSPSGTLLSGARSGPESGLEPDSDARARPSREPTCERQPSDADYQAVVDDFTEHYRHKNGAPPTWHLAAHSALRELMREHPVGEITRRMRIAFDEPPDWPKHPIGVVMFAQHFDRFAKAQSREKPSRISPVRRNEVPPVWEAER